MYFVSDISDFDYDYDYDDYYYYHYLLIAINHCLLRGKENW